MFLTIKTGLKASRLDFAPSLACWIPSGVQQSSSKYWVSVFEAARRKDI